MSLPKWCSKVIWSISLCLKFECIYFFIKIHVSAVGIAKLTKYILLAKLDQEMDWLFQNYSISLHVDHFQKKQPHVVSYLVSCVFCLYIIDSHVNKFCALQVHVWQLSVATRSEKRSKLQRRRKENSGFRVRALCIW